MNNMEKPIKPIEPNASDKKKYPGNPNAAKTMAELEQDPYIRDYRKYQKDMDKYKEDIVLYEQTKFIMDIQRSSLKLCLKKYKVTKR